MDYKKIDNVELDGIDYWDAPDFCDAYIASAYYDGKPMTDEQLDEINEDLSDPPLTIEPFDDIILEEVAYIELLIPPTIIDAPQFSILFESPPNITLVLASIILLLLPPIIKELQELITQLAKLESVIPLMLPNPNKPTVPVDVETQKLDDVKPVPVPYPISSGSIDASAVDIDDIVIPLASSVKQIPDPSTNFLNVNLPD